MNESSKYYPLHKYLKDAQQNIVSLTMADVDNLLGGNLPKRARSTRPWWSNRRTGSAQAAAWLRAGYIVDDLDLSNEIITFRKEGTIPPQELERKGDTVMWNSSMIKALREHMGLSQAAFAQELGVRQPTISEWETQAYQPKRSTSKLLMFVAERAGFEYE